MEGCIEGFDCARIPDRTKSRHGSLAYAPALLPQSRNERIDGAGIADLTKSLRGSGPNVGGLAL